MLTKEDYEAFKVMGILVKSYIEDAGIRVEDGLGFESLGLQNGKLLIAISPCGEISGRTPKES